MKAWAGNRRKLFLVGGGVLNVASCMVLWWLLGTAKPVLPPAVDLPEPAMSALPAFDVASGKPVRVVIPRLGIDLPVGEGFFNPADASWTLGGRQAYYAMPTYFANDFGGNTLIYGHNNKHVFGPMKQAAAGDRVDVYTDNGHVFHYVFETSKVVGPEDVEIFRYTGPPILTIQTCTGNWHEVRLLSRFKFESVTKSQAAVRAKQLKNLKATLVDLVRPRPEALPAFDYSRSIET